MEAAFLTDEQLKEVPRLAPLDVYGALKTSQQGLTAAGVIERREKCGWNRLQKGKSRPLWIRFFMQFKDLFAVILLLAAAITFITYLLGGFDASDLHMTLAILGVVLLNAVIGFTQEYRAEHATEALNKLVPARARVYRDGPKWRWTHANWFRAMCCCSRKATTFPLMPVWSRPSRCPRTT